MSRAFKVVDAFSAKPLSGNPVAVVLDGSGLTDTQMQSIASWTNLSETTFVLPPTNSDASYRLRIFNPAVEMPFAGHPTLGSAHAILEAGIATPRNGKLVQECGVGLVDVAVNGDGPDRVLTLSLPPATVTSLSGQEIDEIEAILGHPIMRDSTPAIIDVGAVWIIAQLASVDAVLGLEPDLVRSAQFEKRKGATGITVFAARSDDTLDIEVRTFAPSCGVNEDPVCGSGNGSVAVFRSTRGLLPAGGSSYRSEQGRRVGRDGKISVAVDARGQVQVGGACVTTIDGVIAV